MSASAQNTPKNGGTNATTGKAQKTQNTGSKQRKPKKTQTLTEKILEIKRLAAPLSHVCIPLTEAAAEEIKKAIAEDPVAGIKPAEVTVEEITPADAAATLLSYLNTYGIDWRIVSETAAQHDANGSSLYCRTYNLTKSNQTLWVYEAELLVELRNIETPDDYELTHLHAVGTSTKHVKDARAAALRNCLVSFFACRFNAPQIAQNDASGGQNEANRPQTGAQTEKQEPRPLSDPQINRLYKKAEAAGCTKEQVAEYVLERYGKKELNTMTREEYDAVCKYYDDNRQPVGR